jgi:N-acetylglucosaminyldiphosphoundecaprenol N-acetyl-beta-D-mannosaminyltransferase
MNTIFSCGIKINPIPTDEIINITDKWLSDKNKGFQITGINLEQIALLSKNKQFSNYINSSDIVNIDGMIVYWYLKIKGYKNVQRTLCADILIRMLQIANERKEKVYLLGATQETIEQLVKNIQHQYPNIDIVGFHNGYFKNEKEIVNDIAICNPDYLFIGMPSPFKERFITTYKKELNTGICFGVGGMFDILAGKAQRAPKQIQSLGLEWLYRITQNPVGHSKRILRAFIPCIKVFCKHLFEKKRQQII